jgi:hypothetical protein
MNSDEAMALPCTIAGEGMKFSADEVESCIRLKTAQLQLRHDRLEHFIRTFCCGVQGCNVDGTVLHEAARQALIR